MIEIWKTFTIRKFTFEVSNFGNLRKIDTKEKISAEFMYCGHQTPYPTFKNHFIHRIVAQLFIPNENNYPQVNHLDCNPLNNNVDNLQWCTQKQNEAWKYIGPNAEKNRQSQRTRAIGNKSTTGHHWKKTDEQRLAQSLRMKGVFNSNNRLGTHHSEETKKKMSEARKAYYRNKRKFDTL